MVSIIVPVYKVEKYLRKCVASILSQTYRDIEVILVDDGSPDASGRVCDELASEDSRIKVIHQKNGGLAAARNAGLAYAMRDGRENKDDFVTFVDSDDTIDQNMYQVMTALANQHQADLVICGHQPVKSEEQICSVPMDREDVSLLNTDQLWDEVFGNLNNAAWNKLYRLDMISDLRFPVGIIHGEDLMFNLQYLCRCKIAVQTDGKFYHYFHRPGSITNSDFSEKKLNEIVAKDAAREFVAEYCPRLNDKAALFCFRARMNVLRSIFAYRKEMEYAAQVDEYRLYVRENYACVSKNLRMKELVEYHLFVSFNPIYRGLTRRK